MPLDFDTASQLRCSTLWYGLAIEGVGTVDGLDIFCNFTPSWADVAARYKSWLVFDSFPDQLGELIDILGGVSESGSISFEVVDGVGIPGDPLYDYLTHLFGFDALEDLTLDSSIDENDLSVDVIGPAEKIAALEEDMVVYIGAEACFITGITPDTSTACTIDISRSELDTEAQSHDAGDQLFFRLPFIAGRKVKLLLGYEEPGYTGEEREVGAGWTIEKNPKRTQGLQAFEFNARSLSQIDRLVFRESFKGIITRVQGTEPDVTAIAIEPIEGSMPISDAEYFDGTVWLKIGEEILQADAPAAARGMWQVHTDRRRVNGTPRTEIKEGQEVLVVLAAEPRWGTSSFRYQPPGPAETSSRGTGTWEQVPHPIPIMLCEICSSAGDDGLELVNFTAGFGNYSGGVRGTGMGWPVGRINIGSFIEIWYRHPEWRLLNLVICKSENGRAWLKREILQPFGLSLTVVDGLLTLFESTVATVATTGDEWDEDAWLVEESPDEEDKYVWVLEQDSADDLQASSVKFIGKNADGIESTIEFDDGDFEGFFGHTKSHFDGDRGEIVIEVPGARFDGAGAHDVWEKRAFGLFLHFRRSPSRINGSTDLSKINTTVFDLRRITHAELGDDVNSVRGWEQVPCRVVNKEVDFEGAKIDWELLSFYHAGKIGLVAPAAIVTSVAADGSNRDLTCIANRFTDAAVPAALNLPNLDAAAFTAGDRVRLRAFDGTIVATTPDYQTVVSRAGSVLKIDGNFGGVLATGVQSPNRILELAEYNDQTATEQATFASYADSATGNKLGDAGDPPFTYGES